jgi:hypothetical protein
LLCKGCETNRRKEWSNKRKPRQRQGFLTSFWECYLVSTPRRSPPHSFIVLLSWHCASDRQHLIDWHKIEWVDKCQAVYEGEKDSKHLWFALVQSKKSESSGARSPRALWRVSLRDQCVAISNLLLPNVPVVNEKLRDGSTISIRSNSANTN